MAWGAYGALAIAAVTTKLNASFAWAALGGIVSATVVTLIIHAVHKLLRKRKASNAVHLIGSIALLIIFNALILLLFGARTRVFPVARPLIITLGGLRMTSIQLTIICVAFLLFIGLALLLLRTRLGKALRALSDNISMAQAVGINPERMYLVTFVLAGILAGVAGVLTGLDTNLYPLMGVPLVVKAFTSAVIGGMGSVPGAIAGAFLLGIAENVGILWLPSGLKDAIAFGLLFLFLIFRPQGLFGVKTERA